MLIQTTLNQLIQLQGPSQVSTVPNLQSFYFLVNKQLYTYFCVELRVFQQKISEFMQFFTILRVFLHFLTFFTLLFQKY